MQTEWYCESCGTFHGTSDLKRFEKKLVCPHCLNHVTAHDERFQHDISDAPDADEMQIAECIKCHFIDTIVKFRELADFDRLELKPGEEVPAGVCPKCQYFAYVLRGDEEPTTTSAPYSAFEDDEYETLLYYTEKSVEFLSMLHKALTEHDYLPGVAKRCKLFVDTICDESYGLLVNPFDE